MLQLHLNRLVFDNVDICKSIHASHTASVSRGWTTCPRPIVASPNDEDKISIGAKQTESMF